MSNNALADSTIRHAVYLERLKAHEVNKITAFLRLVDRSVRDQLSQDITELSRTKLNSILAQVNRNLAQLYVDYYEELLGSLIDMAIYESEFESRSLSNASGANFVLPSTDAVKSLVMTNPLSVRGVDGGKLLEPFIKDWSASSRKQIVNAIRLGVYEGQTNFQIIKNIRGTRAENYADGLLSTTKRHAEAIVRTSIQHVSSAAREKVWDENQQFLTGYRLVATLDSLTSAICRSLDNTVHEFGKGPRTPLHINCRTQMVPELISEYDFLSEGRTRSSLNGYIDANTTYYEWLKRQPYAFQVDAIGKTRADLLNNGGLTAAQFAQLNLGRNFKPLTLAEMREREPVAFERIGL